FGNKQADILHRNFIYAVSITPFVSSGNSYKTIASYTPRLSDGWVFGNSFFVNHTPGRYLVSYSMNVSGLAPSATNMTLSGRALLNGVPVEGSITNFDITDSSKGSALLKTDFILDYNIANLPLTFQFGCFSTSGSISSCKLETLDEREAIVSSVTIMRIE